MDIILKWRIKKLATNLEVDNKKIKSKLPKGRLPLMTLIGLKIFLKRRSIILVKVLILDKNLLMNHVRIFVNNKNSKKKRRKRKRKKINKRSKSLKKILTRPVYHPLMKINKILSHWVNLEKNLFMTFSNYERHLVGHRGSLFSNTLRQIKLWKEKSSNNFWWRKRLRFMKRQGKRISKKVETGKKPYRNKRKQRNKTTLKMSWNCSNFFKTSK